MGKSTFWLCLLLMAASLQVVAQTAEVKGFLYDKKSGEALIYTNVYLKGTRYGIATDVNGFFSITKVPVGNYVLMATTIGYDTIQEPIILEAGRVLSRKLYLNPVERELDVVEIEGSRSTYRRQNTVNVSLTQITPKDIKINPSVGGEADVAQYIQTVPGVVSTGDQGGNVFIRGGSLVQNLTLLDGMVIYNPFHSIGLYSIFDTDLLKTVDFYTAAFGAEYGGRASSVIDARTIDGNQNRHSGQVSANTVAARINLNGPIYKSENGAALTYVASVRHSYLDKLGPSLYPYANKDPYKLGFGFTDLFGKLALTAGSGAKVTLSGFNFTDRADIGAPNQFDWQNSGLGLNFLLTPGGSSVLIAGNFAYSDYSIKASNASSPPRSSGVNGFNGGLDFTYYINRSELKYGLGVVANNTQFSGATATGLLQNPEAYNTEFYGYAHYRINTNKFIIDPGLRFQYYASLSEPRIEPRLGVKYIATDKVRLKASGGFYSQNLLSTKSDRDIVNLFTGFISSPDDVLGADGTKPPNALQLSTHAVVGVEFEPIAGLELDVEVYQKDFSQFINYNIAKTAATDADFIAEKGLARGIDFSAKYETVRGSAKLTYSLSKTTRTYGSTEYPTNYDRRHNINLLVSYFPIRNRRDLEIDVRFNLGSGFPFTQTQAYYENVNYYPGIQTNPYTYNGSLDVYYGTLGDYNQGRLPVYHRLDIAVKKHFVLNTRVRLETTVGTTNVYDRANVFYIDRLNTARRVNQLPILPYLALSASF